MVEPANKSSQAISEEEEDAVPKPAGKKQPESNEIAIREPFEIGNNLKIIYDIAVDGGPKKIANWKIHEGSKVEIHGSGLGLYNQIFLWAEGSTYQQELVDKTQDGRTLSFKVGNEFANAYEDGTGVILEFADSRNRANNRFLKQKLKYFKQTEEEKKRAAQAAKEEKLKQQASSVGGQPGVISQVINESIDVPVTGLAQGLAGSRAKSRPRASIPAGAIKTSGQTELNAEDSDADLDSDLAPDTTPEEISNTSDGAEKVITPDATVSLSGPQQAEDISTTISAPGQTVGGTISTGVSGGADIKTEASVKNTSSVSQTVSGREKSTTTVSGSSQTTQTTKSSTQTLGSVAASGEIKSEQKVSTTETESATQKISGQDSAQTSGQTPKSQETQAESSVSRETDVKANTSIQDGPFKGSSAGSEQKISPEATQTNQTQAEQKVQAKKNISAQAEDRRSEIGESEGTLEEEGRPAPEPIDEDKEKNRGIQTSEKGQPEKKDQSDQQTIKNKSEIKPSATVQPKGQSSDEPQSSGSQKSAPSEVVSPPAGISSMLNKLAANDAKLQPAVGSKQQIDGAGRREKPVNLADTKGAGAGPKKDVENRKSEVGGPEVGSRRPEGLTTQKPEVGASDEPEINNTDSNIPADRLNQSQADQQESESEEENQEEEEPELSPTEQARLAAVNNPFIRRLASSQVTTGEKQLAGLATSRVWNWAVTGAYLSGFTVIGFYLGLIVMDVYWALLHRRDKKLFPLAGWQKAVTIITNLIGIAAPLLLIALIFYVGCNFPVSGKKPVVGYKLSILGAYIGDTCGAFDMTAQRPTSVNPTGEVGGLPAGGGPLSTGDWNKTILEVSSMYQIDACILKVVVQKESANVKDSAGNNAADRAIGCDCAANGHPEYCPDKRKVYSSDYQFNWAQCSYGIGITQWTIFPQGRSGYMAWQSPGIPSRNLVYGVSGHPDIWYTVNDLLNPTTSLELAAKTFAANMKKVNRSGPPFNRSDVQAAFMAYVGSSSRQAQLVADRMALYDMCKNSSGTAAP